jgi:hypothetical protein
VNRRAVLFVALLVVLTLVSALWPRSPSPLASSSFGQTGAGHGALYELLSELGLSRGRSFEAPNRLDDEGTLWWIDPQGVCDGRIARSGEVDVLDPEEVVWPAAGWLQQGGVAVVLLQSADPGGSLLEAQDRLVACDAIAGARLPLRVRLDPEDPPVPAVVESPALFAFAASRDAADGGRARLPRALAQGAVYAFEEALDWTVASRVARADSQPLPFVLTRAMGGGLLVVVADSGFTHNRWLDTADSAPLAVDLVAAFGPPRLDEREHGILPETSAFRYLASSPALPVYLGLALLGVLYAWRGHALPARSVVENDAAAPTLETWIHSLASLYAAGGDHARVLERYRELTAARLRRHFGLPHEVSRRALAERIERDTRSRGEERSDPLAARRRRERLAWLVEARPVTSAAELEAAVGELDILVREVTR